MTSTTGGKTLDDDVPDDGALLDVVAAAGDAPFDPSGVLS